MRINIFEARLNEFSHPILFKENSMNYCVDTSFNMPTRIVTVMNEVFHLNEMAEEFVYMASLNTKLVPTSFFLISKGNVNSSLISPREVLIRALLSGATHIILIHNHPSRDTTPSSQDLQVTKRIMDASQIVGIILADHIIIGGDSFLSFKERNLI
ncbi:JAB domain-containing protein [[Clostridium] fimetarium]|uniref:DNA repair protein RadC n=1 Tax=[Clostridium] fimetarium TaxID=99656 RepID=A0A1I0QVW6_9FIRM|nr:JAB domain-containing protein [[Clostridium] fimetarium]SEW31822.1 DNA repair protein RadC [[Clostridium] fimetarium]